MSPRNDARRPSSRRAAQLPTAPKGNGYPGPVLAIAAGAVIAVWSVTRLPYGFWPGVLLGAGMIAVAANEIRWRRKARQIANRATRGRGGYVDGRR